MLTSSPLLALPGYISPGQVTAVHPFVMHQQGVAHSLTANIPQSHMGHYQNVQPASTIQEWHTAQAGKHFK